MRRASVPFSSMADIAFLLLIFLLVISIIAPSPPKVSIPEAVVSSPLEGNLRFDVYITKEGTIFYAGKKVNVEDLVYFYKMHGVKKVVVVHADRDVPFLKVWKVLQALKLEKGKLKVLFVVKTKNG